MTCTLCGCIKLDGINCRNFSCNAYYMPEEIGEPKKKSKAKPPRPVAILDIETDPFLYGRVPVPFVVGIYTAALGFVYFWDDDCIPASVQYLANLEQEHIVYAHNGGKFDWMYYMHLLSGSLRIINGRIVSARLCQHEIRDSYSIMPFPLRDYKKDEIDYRLLESDIRESHKSEIIDYLRGDCVYLSELVTTFHEEFGQRKLTIGSTAMTEIKERHPFERTTLAFDRVFRPTFFYGGRVQCFKAGITEMPVKIYDVNSMYPAMMRDIQHPSGSDYIVGDEITDDTVFVIAEGKNAGAFPQRNRNTGGLDFDSGNGIYSVTRHEYDAGIDTGSFLPKRIIATYDFPVRNSFADFVNHFFDARKEAKKLGDDIRGLLYKFCLNSGYGKFAQNPANFFDWKLATLADRPDEPCPHCRGRGQCNGCFKCQALNDYAPVTDRACIFCGGSGARWMLHEYDAANPAGPMFWKARTFVQSYYNVATGASITGAARATLLRGLSDADDPIYCDTDSIITGGEFHGPVSSSELGQWKCEGSGILSAIAGKKLYAIFTDRRPEISSEDARKYPWMLEPIRWKRRNLWCVKKAHKGLRLSPEQILYIAQGFEIEVANAAPTFGLFKEPTFIKRVARMTA